MSNEIATIIKWNPQKVKTVRGEESLSQFAVKTGLKLDLLSKIERGKRKPSLETLEQLCATTNKFPNDFFDISVK